ncbi:MAG: hypothetical protein H0U95_15700 [Bacteroidetes bacterium]|nr:hypothetical protein [Bacteroidota bacterium]
MKPNYSKIFVIVLGVLVLAYISAKAYLSSFTHDESFTYLTYVHTSFMDIISFSNWYTNNHILNSLFMKYSEQLFGCSELALRLPNLLLFCVYITYCYLLFKKSDQLLIIAILLLLCTNNSLIDLFGLGRGYGMSYGFMVMSLYHFIRSFYDQKTKNIILFHTGALLAVLSNFTALDLYVSLLVIYNMIVFIDVKLISNKKYNFFSANKAHLLPLIVVIIILFEPVRRLLMSNGLDFGGKNGFYEDTVNSLIHYTLQFPHIPQFILVCLQILFTGSVLIPFVFIIRMIMRKNEAFFINFKGFIISNFLLALISLAIVLQRLIFKADYPVSRFSLFLFPLFILHFGFLLSYLSSVNFKRSITVAAFGLALVSLTAFTLKLNLRSCSEWEFDMETKNMLQKLTEYHQKTNSDPQKIKLEINWLFEPTINFYRQTKDLDWLLPADRNGISTGADYYYIFKNDLDKLTPDSYDIITEYNKINTLLIRNKQKS